MFTPRSLTVKGNVENFRLLCMKQVQSGDYNDYIFFSDHERQLCNNELVSTRGLKMGFQ